MLISPPSQDRTKEKFEPPSRRPRAVILLLIWHSSEHWCSKEGILLSVLPFCFLDFWWLWVYWLSLCWGYSSRDRKNNGSWPRLTMPPVSGEESLCPKQNALLWCKNRLTSFETHSLCLVWMESQWIKPLLRQWCLRDIVKYSPKCRNFCNVGCLGILSTSPPLFPICGIFLEVPVPVLV